MNYRGMLLCLCVLTLLPSGPGASAGQASMSAEVEAMKKLDRWVGAWKGTGWTSLVGDQRVEFNVSERVQRRVGDSVFLVEGRGATHNDKGEEVVTHDGLVLVYYDKKSGRYHWHGHDIGRGAVDVEPKLIDDGLEWSLSLDGSNAVVRFTLRFDDKQWREVGDLSGDGKNWKRFMEMTLEREK